MPILKINETTSRTTRNATAAQANGKFVILVDEDTSRAFDASTSPGLFESDKGIINGITGQGVIVRMDHGLDTDDISPKSRFPGALQEVSYTVQMDSRLGSIVPPVATRSARSAAPSRIDDDNIAHYQLDLATDAAFVQPIQNQNTVEEDTTMVIKGPRDNSLSFSIRASVELQDSNRLFTRLGSLNQSWTRTDTTSATVHYIDTVIRIMGNTTGYRIDVPVRFVKKIS